MLYIMFTISRVFFVLQISFNGKNFAKASPISGMTHWPMEGEFPFVVSIGRKFDVHEPNIYGHNCGGALITDKHVLTAARCFRDDRTANDYFVYYGSNDLEKCTAIGIKSWITYNGWIKKRARCDYGYQFKDNDIAVIELSTNIRRLPTMLPKLSKSSPESFTGKTFISAGWGLLFTDSIPKNLLKANLQVIDDRKCLTNIWKKSNNYYYNHEHNIFCTNGAELFAVFDDGDRGSPIFFKNANGEYEIVGVNKYSIPAIKEIVELPDQQNIHISVYYYMRFLKSVTGSKILS